MARLEGAHDDGGRRYSLSGRPIGCGQTLEVSVRGGWLPVRFEMDLQQFPLFCLRLSEGRSLESQVEFRLPDTAELRWPLQQDVPEDTQVRKLPRVVEDLAEIVHAPEDHTEDERDLAVLRARAVLHATAILNALLGARTLGGADGRTAHALAPDLLRGAVRELTLGGEHGGP